MKDMLNQVVFITGGSRGIGKAIALRFARAGAKVAICGRKPESLREAEQELRAITPNVLAVTADIADGTSIRNAVADIQDQWGTIDILVNNAGIYRPGSVLDTSPEEWDRQFAINLKGPFLTTQAVIPQMMERRRGTIIFISSAIALISPPDNSCYTATKRGLEGFVGCIAQELCEYGIKVHVVRPGFTDTSIFDEIGKPPLEIDWIDPAEIAAAVEFLCRLPEHAQVPELTYLTTFQRKSY